MGQTQSASPKIAGNNVTYSDANLDVKMSLQKEGGLVSAITIELLKIKNTSTQDGLNSGICSLLTVLKYIENKLPINLSTTITLGSSFYVKAEPVRWNDYFNQKFKRKDAAVALGFRVQNNKLEADLFELMRNLEYLCNGTELLSGKKQREQFINKGKQINEKNKQLLEKSEATKSKWKKAAGYNPVAKVQGKAIYNRKTGKCMINCDGQLVEVPPEHIDINGYYTGTIMAAPISEPIIEPVIEPVMVEKSKQLNVMSPIQQRIQLNKKNVDERLQAKVKQLKIEEQERQAKKEINREQNRIAKAVKDEKRNANIERQKENQKKLSEQGIDDYAKTAGFELFFGRKRKCKCNHKAELKYLTSL
jgi:hypothetical protein